MVFHRHIPGPPLAEFIDWLWYYEHLYPSHRREHVLPDGTFELVINLRDEPRKLFDRRDATRFDVFRRGWISGAHSAYIIIDALPGSSMMGAHFKPAGAAALLGVPADEVRDRIVELDAFWGLGAWRLRDRLLEARGAPDKFRLLGDFLVEQLGKTRMRVRSRARVLQAVRRFAQEPDQITIGRVAEELGITHKHLIDEFRRQVGLTPKLFCRIRRFQQVLSRIQAREPVDWADVALSCGYYDQAHFVHDFKAFSGMNPCAFLRHHLDEPNFVPLDD